MRLLDHIPMSGDEMIIILLVAFGGVTLSATWHWLRSRFLLKEWARANGFELLRMNSNWFKSGPFVASKRQEIYHIRVRDRGGR